MEPKGNKSITKIYPKIGTKIDPNLVAYFFCENLYAIYSEFNLIVECLLGDSVYPISMAYSNGKARLRRLLTTKRGDLSFKRLLREKQSETLCKYVC